ncbi:MAG: signal peptidase I [Polyangiaceae bacterium]
MTNQATPSPPGTTAQSRAKRPLFLLAAAVFFLLLLGARVLGCVRSFKIPSASMVPTVLAGDHLYVNGLSYGPAIPFTNARLWTSMPPHRGDVIVFQFPEHPEQEFIKRVIALPGDKLEAKNGHPFINGWAVPSCYVGIYSYSEPETSEYASNTTHEGKLFVEYLEDKAYATLYTNDAGGFSDAQGPFSVQEGEVYVLGDNRNNSHDSRMWGGGQGGGVPVGKIRAKSLFVWLSATDSGVDFSRTGTWVMGRPKLPPAMSGLQPALDKCLQERPPLEKTTPPPPSASASPAR